MKKSSKSVLSRRALLAGGGALGASYWLRRPDSLHVHAQDEAAIPRRLVIFYTPQGMLRDLWSPTGTETDFNLGELHSAALDKHKSNLLIMKGISMLSHDVDPTPGANAHIAGSTHALTGAHRASAELPSGPSIDVFIANELAKQGIVTKLPSLELSTWPVRDEGNVSFNLDGSPVPFLYQPAEQYDRVFGDFVAPDDSGAAARLGQRELLLRWAAGEYTEQAQRLSGDDRVKLEAHGDLIRDLQRRMALGVGCAAPELVTFPPGTGLEVNHANAVENALRTTTAALACDLTRVVTIAVTELQPQAIDTVGYVAGHAGTNDMHDLVHKTAENGELRDNPDARAPVVRLNQLFSSHYARLLDMLDAVPEGDGNSLLHHTAVLWAGQIASGSHDLHQLPWMIGGQGGGHFRTGRFLDYMSQGQEYAHNDLLVSLARYMGVQIDTFGIPEVCRGELPGLT